MQESQPSDALRRQRLKLLLIFFLFALPLLAVDNQDNGFRVGISHPKFLRVVSP